MPKKELYGSSISLILCDSFAPISVDWKTSKLLAPCDEEDGLSTRCSLLSARLNWLWMLFSRNSSSETKSAQPRLLLLTSTFLSKYLMLTLFWSSER